MMGGFRGRFGSRGIYRDPRILIPVVIMGLIRVVAANYTPEHQLEALQVQTFEQSIAHQRPQARGHVDPIPEAGTYEIQRIRLDDSPAPWMPSPLLIAGGVGGGLLVMGAAGALMILRRQDDEVADFYGDREISDLVARHERG